MIVISANEIQPCRVIAMINRDRTIRAFDTGLSDRVIESNCGEGGLGRGDNRKKNLRGKTKRGTVIAKDLYRTIPSRTAIRPAVRCLLYVFSSFLLFPQLRRAAKSRAPEMCSYCSWRTPSGLIRHSFWP